MCWDSLILAVKNSNEAPLGVEIGANSVGSTPDLKDNVLYHSLPCLASPTTDFGGVEPITPVLVQVKQSLQ
jgi:hypothetical protein